MNKNVYLFIFLNLLLLFSIIAHAQVTTGTVRLAVTDQKKLPVEFATVLVVKASDSTLVKNSTTDKSGFAAISGLQAGNYRLIVAQLGLKRLNIPFSISAGKTMIDLGERLMEPDVRNLKEVAINGVKVTASVKGDTTEFNAGAFKTQPNDNVEQLLKKIPGVDVDKDGKITAQGQSVNKVLVDGKEFFGNDPKAATKNLPADAIDKVQLIDDKTDRTKNTGIDDGQREKVVNLKLKDDKKSGWFGNASAAGGNTDRYLGQFNLNHFDKKVQFSALFLSNNVNESGFTMEDLNNFTGGNVFDAFASGNGTININVNSNGRANINGAFSGVSGGLITNHTGGLNFSDSWGPKDRFKLNASLISVISSNNLIETDNTQDPAQNILTNQNINGNNKYNSYRLNLNMEYKLDTLTTLKFKPTLSTGYKNNLNTTGFLTSDFTNAIKNQGLQVLNQTIRTPALGGQISVNHKFANGKGSVNVFSTGNISAYKSKATNQFRLNYPDNSTVPDSTSNLQTGQNDNATVSNTTASFIRQLSKRRKLNFTFGQNYQYRNDNASQTTLDYNPVNGRYEIVAPNYSGLYDNTNWRYSTTIGLNKGGEKTTLNLNADIADLGLKGTFTGVNSSMVSRSSWALVPNASFSYRPKNGSNVFISLRSDVSMPSITDLQPIQNTTNLTYKKIGNPDLQMSRTLSLNTNMSRFDMKTNNFFNLYGNFTESWNGFSTESFYDNTGVTTSRPINTDGNFTSNFGLNIGHPTKVKGLRINFGLNGSINRNVNFINNNKNAVLRIAPGVNLGSSYDGEVFQFGVRTYTTYNNAKNSFQHLADNQYYSYNNNFTASVKPVKSLRIYSEFNQSLYRGTPANANTSVYLLNAGIERYFMKGQNLTLALSGYDLLNQNSGIQRSLSATGQINSSITNTIGQYFYLKLTYKISKMGSGQNNSGGNGIIIMR